MKNFKYLCISNANQKQERYFLGGIYDKRILNLKKERYDKWRKL